MMLVVAFAFLQHLSLADEPKIDRNPFTTHSDVEQGQRLYGGRCAGCHGPAGDGGKGTNLATPTLPRAQTDVALYRVIRYGLPDTEMPRHNMSPREIWQIAAYVRSLGRAGASSLKGDPSRGAVLVKSKVGCLGCHVLDGDGIHLGPPLTDVGRRRSPAYLKTKLVDPGRDLAANFSMVKLATRDGLKVTGVRLNEDTWSIQVRDMDMRLHSVWKQDLAELVVERRTIMPSYAKKLSEKQLDDIVAFLAAAGESR